MATGLDSLIGATFYASYGGTATDVGNLIQFTTTTSDYYNQQYSKTIIGVEVVAVDDTSSSFTLRVFEGVGYTYLQPNNPYTAISTDGHDLLSGTTGYFYEQIPGSYYNSSIGAEVNPPLTETFDPNGTYVACYCSGTMIRLDGGDVAVEELAIGHLVVTASGVHRPIKWIARRAYTGRFLQANPGVQPIRFKAGSLDGTLPYRDLLVSPEHAMFLDGVLVPARYLVNDITIIQEHRLDRVDYFHVELDTHDVLLAEGAASESFLDDNSRGVFHNAAEFAALYPAADVSCGFRAQRVTDGYQLEAIRSRLHALALTSAVAA